MRNKNFVRKKQAIYISPNKKSTRIIKTLMDFSLFIKIKIKMVCFSVPSLKLRGGFKMLYIAYGKITAQHKKMMKSGDIKYRKTAEKG